MKTTKLLLITLAIILFTSCQKEPCSCEMVTYERLILGGDEVFQPGHLEDPKLWETIQIQQVTEDDLCDINISRPISETYVGDVERITFYKGCQQGWTSRRVARLGEIIENPFVTQYY